MVTTTKKTVGTSSDFATLELWEATQAKNCVSSDVIERAAMKNEVHTADFNFSSNSWGTDATRYAWIDADDGAEHDGTTGSGARIICDTANNVIKHTEDEVLHITRMEISTSTATSSQKGIQCTTAAGGVHVDRCIIHGFDTSGRGFICNKANYDITIVNCMFFDNATHNIDMRSFETTGGPQTSKIYNNTLHGGTNDFKFDTNGAEDDHDMDLRNNGIHGDTNSMDGDNATDAVWNAGCDQNIGSDTRFTTHKLKGTIQEDVTFQAGTSGSGERFMMVNLTAGSEDLRLVDDAGNFAQDYGNNLTSETMPSNIFIAVDIEGNTRPAAGSWDAGCHQVTVGGLSIPVAMANYRRRHELRL